MLWQRAETSHYFHGVSKILVPGVFSAPLKQPPTKKTVESHYSRKAKRTTLIRFFLKISQTYCSAMVSNTLRLLNLTQDCQLFFPFVRFFAPLCGHVTDITDQNAEFYR